MTQITLQPDLRVLRAQNPSPLTGDGTNTYLLGEGDLCVIDPGPSDPRHLEAILRAVSATGTLRAILVTHAHLDHSPLARPLAEASGAPIMGFGDAQAGRSARMDALAASGLVGGGEGVDHGFRPDTCLADGQVIEIGAQHLRAIWTPGHFGNHLCFAWGDVIFSGDHVMGWSSTLVSPPDGDLSAYMRSLDRLDHLGARRLYPGHGAQIDDPAQRIAELRAHRMARMAQILEALGSGAQTVAELVAQIYTETPVTMHKAAGRNVLAHLIDLEARGLVVAHPDLSADARFTRVPTELRPQGA